MDRSWECINRSQIHERGSWGPRPRSFISGNICFEFSVYSVFAVCLGQLRANWALLKVAAHHPPPPHFIYYTNIHTAGYHLSTKEAKWTISKVSFHNLLYCNALTICHGGFTSHFSIIGMIYTLFCLQIFVQSFAVFNNFKGNLTVTARKLVFITM